MPDRPELVVPLPDRPWGATSLVTRTLLRIHLPLVVAVGIAVAAGAVLRQPVLLHGALCLALLGGSAVLHEAAHALAHRALSTPPSPAELRASASSARITWAPISTGRDLVVVLAGPLAPAVATLVAAPALLLWPAGAVVATIAAIAHPATLALRSGDGAELRAILRRRRLERCAAPEGAERGKPLDPSPGAQTTG